VVITEFPVLQVEMTLLHFASLRAAMKLLPVAVKLRLIAFVGDIAPAPSIDVSSATVEGFCRKITELRKMSWASSHSIHLEGRFVSLQDRSDILASAVWPSGPLARTTQPPKALAESLFYLISYKQTAA
jgi:hypothetical protein